MFQRIVIDWNGLGPEYFVILHFFIEFIAEFLKFNELKGRGK